MKHNLNWQGLARLKENWDSYGAKPLDKPTIEKAREVWNRVRLYREQWSVVPCSDGSVQLERHADGWDIEIHISRAPSSASPVITTENDNAG